MQGPDRAPTPHPRTLDQDASPGLEPGWDVQEGGPTGGLGMPGPLLADSRLSAICITPGRKETKGGIQIPRAQFLKWLDSSKSQGCPCPLEPLHSPTAFPKSTLPSTTEAGQITSSSGPRS